LKKSERLRFEIGLLKQITCVPEFAKLALQKHLENQLSAIEKGEVKDEEVLLDAD